MSYNRRKITGGTCRMSILKIFNWCAGVFGGMFLFGFVIGVIGGES